MKRLFVKGVMWPIPRQPYIVLSSDEIDSDTNDEQSYGVGISCTAAEFGSLVTLTQRDGTKGISGTATAMLKMLVQLNVSVNHVELVEQAGEVDCASIQVLSKDGVVTAISVTCVEAIIIAVIFNRPMFGADGILRTSGGQASGAQQVNQTNQTNQTSSIHDVDRAADFNAFVGTVKPSDFTAYAKSREPES